MERAVERDDSLPLRVEPRELDRVLDRLGACVEECGASLTADRRKCTQALGELDVALVWHHREVRMEEPIHLIGDRLHDSRMVVTDVRHTNASDEVDEGIAVDVDDRRAARAIRDDRLVDDQRMGDGVLFTFEDLAAAGTGNLRADLDHTGRRHAREPR